jgi:hypothetical protein
MHSFELLQRARIKQGERRHMVTHWKIDNLNRDLDQREKARAQNVRRLYSCGTAA